MSECSHSIIASPTSSCGLFSYALGYVEMLRSELSNSESTILGNIERTEKGKLYSVEFGLLYLEVLKH